MIEHLRRATAAHTALTQAMLAQMAAHWHLLLRWNAKVNLTAITQPQEAAFAHYADSLAAMAYLAAGPVLDVGSGGGFPGMVLAIAMPHLHFTLLEPRQKRVSFLQTAQARLNLANVSVICGRLEQTPDKAYAHAVSRAVFSDARMFAMCRPWLAPGGSVMAYRAIDAPLVSDSNYPVQAHTYEVGARRRRIDVWTFPQSAS